LKTQRSQLLRADVRIAMGDEKGRVARIIVLVLWVGFTLSIASAADNSGILVTAAQIRSLTAEDAARAIPVSITGVVTLSSTKWKGRFFIEDSTGGVFVNSTKKPRPAAGDLLQVSGVSHAGGYTPDIESAQWTKLGTAPLPVARPISGGEFMSGTDDGDRVEVSGTVTSASVQGTSLELQLESGGYHFRAYPPFTHDIDPNSLVGAIVRVRGTAAVVFDASQRRLVDVTLFVPQASDLIVDEWPKTYATTNILTSTAEILSLKGNQTDEQLRVAVTGVVTVAEPNWGQSFFIQDATGGAFVNSAQNPRPIPGDLVEVRGISHLGSYAPDIISLHWTKLGTAPLPEARKVSADRLMSGAEDGQRIEISCVLRSASMWSDDRLGLDLSSGGYEFQAFVVPPFTNFDPGSLAGATVRIRGTAAASFNSLLRQMVSVSIFMPQKSDLIVDQLPSARTSDLPLIPLNATAQYRQIDSTDPRVRVKGIVTYQRPYTDIFLHDDTGGLEIKGNDTNAFAPGETVEAIGFPALKNFLPVLEDAILIREDDKIKPVEPIKVVIPDLLKGYHNSDLVSLQGKLLYRSLQRLRAVGSSDDTPDENILTLQNGDNIFNVEAPGIPEFAGLADIPIGSTLEVSGISMLQTDDVGRIVAVQVLLRDPADLQVMQLPNWWTVQRLLIVLGVLLAVSLVAITWTLTIVRKNAALQLSIGEKAKAQRELQKAHDQLETRVQERTRELKFEMGARREAEIQFKAVVAERTRLAQELHDTLLQGFAGIGLKLDALANNLPPSLADTKEQMKKILDQSDDYLTEARRTVWELRSPTLELPGNFPQALEIEDNFLRICQEAVANAVKHANPTEVEVTLDYGAGELQLWIRDNGRGFDLDGGDMTKAGHFGLVGIRERTLRLGGKLALESQRGKGTEILVTICPTPEPSPT
jgi:signal transduction histidine kinase